MKLNGLRFKDEPMEWMVEFTFLTLFGTIALLIWAFFIACVIGGVYWLFT